MNTFHERIYSNESKKMFRKITPNICEMADLILKEIELKFSTSQYVGGRTLTRNWIASEQFQAYASVKKECPNEHSINIAYGVAIGIRQDAILFPELCIRHLTESKYHQLFELMDFGNGPKQILPSDLDSENARNKFFQISLAWIYLHEQAHLFQNHGSLYAEATGETTASNQFIWSDGMFANASNYISQSNSWIKHSFELAADYEATNLLLGLLIIEDAPVLKQSSVWLFIATLTCFFHKFYGGARPHHNGLATGTHPDPALRMRASFLNIQETLLHPEIAKYVPWAKTQEDLNLVMEHAYNAANIYMQIAHFSNPEFPEFMRRVVDSDELDKKYFSGISDVWCQLRPKVLLQYFGFGEESVMPIFNI